MASSVGPGYAGPAVGPNQVAASTTSVTLLAAAGSRRGFIIWNNTAVVLTVAFSSSAASATNATFPLAAGAIYEQEAGTATYAGPVQGILASSTGNVQVTAW